MTGVYQSTLEKYADHLARKASGIATELGIVIERQEVRRIEQEIIEAEVLTDEQVSLLAKASIAYVGTYGDSMDDHELARDLRARLAAVAVLQVQVEKKLAGI